MEKVIKFPEKQDTAYFLGRNGEGKCTGIAFNRINNGFELIHIDPITSKGERARCAITFPVDKLDEVINALIALKNGTTAVRQGDNNGT